MPPPSSPVWNSSLECGETPPNPQDTSLSAREWLFSIPQSTRYARGLIKSSKSKKCFPRSLRSTPGGAPTTIPFSRTTCSCPSTHSGSSSSRKESGHSSSARSSWTFQSLVRNTEFETDLIVDNRKLNASSADKAPPLKDCSEVYRVGATTPGWYELDTTGSMSNTDQEEVYCEDGWTHILRRNPKEARSAYVSSVLFLRAARSAKHV